MLPGRLIRVVVVRRPVTPRVRTPGQRKPPPPVEAFFTTDLTLSLEAILEQYRDRWAVEITIRDRNAFAGFGQGQCRQVEQVGEANTLRLVLAAARPLWCVEQASRADTLDWQRYRPWYPEVRPQPTRRRLGLPRSVARGRGFSHTSVRSRSCQKSPSARECSIFNGVGERN